MYGVFTGEVLAALSFLVTIIAVTLGYPVAFTLAGVGLLFAGLGIALDIFDPALLSALGNRYLGIMLNESLVAVPLFVFMGIVLERSKIAEALLTTMGELFGNLRGGLGYSVVLVGALLAASTGIVGATVVTMGLLSLPAMMRANYDPKLATGVIAASGTLGQIIPPSTVLIFVGDILQSANQQAQLSLGNLSPDPVSVGQLFAGALLPGLMLVGFYILWIVFKAFSDPRSCPPAIADATQSSKLWQRVLFALLPPLALVLAVLGSILAGIATPTESAAVGAMGALALAWFKGRLSLSVLQEIMRSTLAISSMVFIILLGASVFSLTFRGLGGEELVYDLMADMPGGSGGAVFAVMLLMFTLGFFLDTFEIIFIVVPIAAPILIRLGVDPVWLGVMIGVNLQTSFLTPPFGFALFYLRGAASSAIRTIDIYRGAIPFVGIQLFSLLVLWFFPAIVTKLPELIYSTASAAPPAVEIRTYEQTKSGKHSVDDFTDLFSPESKKFHPPSDDFHNLFDSP